MQLKAAQLATHLKQGLKPVYVVAGEEPLLIQEALDAIRAAARQQGYSEREVLEVAPGFQWNRLAEAGASLSLFASKRIVELHAPRGLGAGRRKSLDDETENPESAEAGSGGSAQEGAKLLQDWAAKPPPDVLLLVVGGAIDYKARGGGWFAALDNAGASLYFPALKPEELPAWIAARFKAAGLEADTEGTQELAERTEGNLLACAQDIDKMKLLFAGKKIGTAEVRDAVADRAHFGAFDLIDKMLTGDAAGTARSLGRIREEGVPLPQLMGAVSYALRQWANAAVAYRQTRSIESALAAAKLFGTRARPYEAALKRSHGLPVLRALARCAHIDRRAKTTEGKEAAWEDLLELLLTAAGSPLLPSPSRL